jgi:hypothetical protein
MSMQGKKVPVATIGTVLYDKEGVLLPLKKDSRTGKPRNDLCRR